MHAAIFLGFMSLAVRKLQLIAIGYDEVGRLSRHRRRRCSPAVKDVVELAVLAACGYALYRRFVHEAAASRAQPGGARSSWR